MIAQICFEDGLTRIAKILPQLGIIDAVEKIPDMDWIWEVFGYVISVGS
jgi:hypothetical protein